MDPSKIEPTNLGLRAAAALARATQPDAAPSRPAPDAAPPGRWADMMAANPGHSAWYVERFRRMAASGADLVGEARLVDALAPRGARILDAGCGPGRHAGYLHRAGHTVVGVDLDPVLIEAAEADEPGPRYVVGDLTVVALPDDAPAEFDVISCAGNVMTFLHPDTRRPILARFAAWLAPGGRAVIGFGAGRGYPFEEFLADAAASGLGRHQLFSSWDLRPLEGSSDFIVALLSRDQD